MDTDILPKSGRILCAVSGGADSMYLLCRLLALGFDVAAAHYNHGLRGAESDRDELFVRDFCAQKGIPFISESGDTASYALARRMGVEEAARTLRYDFLERAADSMGACVIATAHTANDNAETLLLNLARGTGLKGLGGIPPSRGRIRRPILDVTRDEVTAYLHDQGIGFVEDSTNLLDEYARNRVRHEIVPLLERVNPAFIRAANSAAGLLRRDEAYLQELAEQFIAEFGDGNSLAASALTARPWPVASRAVRLMAGRELSAVHVEAALKVARDGGAANLPGLRVAKTGDRLWFGARRAARIPDTVLAFPGETDVPGAGLAVRCAVFTTFPQVVHRTFNIFFFNYASICGNIILGSRREGDRFCPAGRGCAKKVRRLMRERGVPPWMRDGVPVLRDEKGVIGVFGVGEAERVSARPNCEKVLRIEIVRYEADGEDGNA